jgi:hypothetical protein
VGDPQAPTARFGDGAREGQADALTATPGRAAGEHVVGSRLEHALVGDVEREHPRRVARGHAHGAVPVAHGIVGQDIHDLGDQARRHRPAGDLAVHGEDDPASLASEDAVPPLLGSAEDVGQRPRCRRPADGVVPGRREHVLDGPAEVADPLGRVVEHAGELIGRLRGGGLSSSSSTLNGVRSWCDASAVK